MANINYSHITGPDFLGPSALTSILARERPTLLCFSKSSKTLSPVVMRLLSKMQNAEVGIIYVFYILSHMDLHSFFQSLPFCTLETGVW